MRFALALVALLIGGVLVGPRAVAVSRSDEPAMHPLVGSWVVTLTSTVDESETALFTFFADGNLIATDEHGKTWQGYWERTSDRGGRYALIELDPSELGGGTTRVGNAVADDTGDIWNWPEPGRPKSGMSSRGVRMDIFDD